MMMMMMIMMISMSIMMMIMMKTMMLMNIMMIMMIIMIWLDQCLSRLCRRGPAVRRGRNRLEDQGNVLRKRLLVRLAVGYKYSHLFSYILYV